MMELFNPNAFYLLDLSSTTRFLTFFDGESRLYEFSFAFLGGFTLHTPQFCIGRGEFAYLDLDSLYSPNPLTLRLTMMLFPIDSNKILQLILGQPKPLALAHILSTPFHSSQAIS
jgi:hypothetical protein